METIRIDCICFDKTGGWIFDSQLRSLYQYDERTERISSFNRLPDGMTRSPIQMTECMDKLYFFPYWDKTLLIFDIRKETFEEIEIKIGACANESAFLYYIGKEAGHIYLYAVYECTIIDFNAENMVQKQYRLPPKYLRKISSNGAIYVEGTILFPMVEKNAVLEFRLETGEIREYVIEGFSGGVDTIAYDGKYYWITGHEKYYAKWDKKTETVIEKRNFPDTLEIYVMETEKWENYQNVQFTLSFPFLNNVVMQNKLYLFPYVANMILEIDTQSGRCRECLLPERDRKGVPNVKPCELMAADCERHIIAVQDSEKRNYILDLESMELKEKRYVAESDFYMQFLKENIVWEDSHITLQTLIEAMHDTGHPAAGAEGKRAGKAIYDCVTGKI